MEIIHQEGSYTVKKAIHGDANLWTALCPFAVSRKVRRELGIAISSDENHVWFLVFDKSNCVAIAAVEFCNGSKAKFRHAYVVDEHRERGLYKLLLDLREKTATGKQVTLTVTVDALSIVLKAGYIKIGRRGKYTVASKQL
jgi:hypothetical protein